MNEESTLKNSSQYTDELINFIKEYIHQGKTQPIKYKEWLTVCIHPYPMIGVDEVTKLSKGLLSKIPGNSFCRQYVYDNAEWRERSIEEIKIGDPENMDVIYVEKIDSSFNGPNYFRVTQEVVGIVKGGDNKGETVGGSKQFDAEWDGKKIAILPKTQHILSMS